MKNNFNYKSDLNHDWIKLTKLKKLISKIQMIKKESKILFTGGTGYYQVIGQHHYLIRDTILL